MQGEAYCRPERFQCTSQPLQGRELTARTATLVLEGFQPIPWEDVDTAFQVAFNDPSSVDDFVNLVTDMLVDIPLLANQVRKSNITSISSSIQSPNLSPDEHLIATSTDPAIMGYSGAYSYDGFLIVPILLDVFWQLFTMT